jgi:hypothetical protein
MSQTHGITMWTEPAGNGAVPALTPLVFKIVDGGYTLVPGTVPDAVAIDLGDGVYTITEVTDPAYDPAAPAEQFVQVRGAVVGY